MDADVCEPRPQELRTSAWSDAEEDQSDDFLVEDEGGDTDAAEEVHTNGGDMREEVDADTCKPQAQELRASAWSDEAEDASDDFLVEDEDIAAHEGEEAVAIAVSISFTSSACAERSCERSCGASWDGCRSLMERTIGVTASAGAALRTIGGLSIVSRSSFPFVIGLRFVLPARPNRHTLAPKTFGDTFQASLFPYFAGKMAICM